MDEATFSFPIVPLSSKILSEPRRGLGLAGQVLFTLLKFPDLLLKMIILSFYFPKSNHSILYDENIKNHYSKIPSLEKLTIKVRNIVVKFILLNLS